MTNTTWNLCFLNMLILVFAHIVFLNPVLVLVLFPDHVLFCRDHKCAAPKLKN